MDHSRGRDGERRVRRRRRGRRRSTDASPGGRGRVRRPGAATSPGARSRPTAAADLAARAWSLVEGWPPGGLAVGLLPDASDPGRSARAVLLLAAAAAELREAPLLLDLAPSATDLATRFGAAGKAGFAELVAGKAELWEIVHPARGREAFYVPAGRRAPGDGLAGSRPIRTLAERVRRKEHLLFVLLDPDAADLADSAVRMLDGFVLLGRRGNDALGRLPPGAALFGSLTWRKEPAETEDAPDRRGTGRRRSKRRSKRTNVRVGRRSRRGPRRWWRRFRRWLGRAFRVLVLVVVMTLASILGPAVLNGLGG